MGSIYLDIMAEIETAVRNQSRSFRVSYVLSAKSEMDLHAVNIEQAKQFADEFFANNDLKPDSVVITLL